MKRLSLIIVFVLFLTGIGKSQDNEARLMRFPTVHENTIVFTYAGDLYSVPVKGGVAKKLTNHVGYEMFAKISPDGKHIAFTGQYDGNTEVYIMPAEGGVPKRLTFTATLNRDDVSDRMGPNNIVMAWSPDSKSIIYRSRRYSYNSFRGKLFSVTIDGGLSTELPITDGGFCSYSPDGKKLAFNWVFREFRTWKYYKGGMADDVRIYDFDTKKTEKITDNPAQDILPMWHGDEIYFLSDRNRQMNMFSYNVKTKQTKQITEYKDYDIKFPSIGGNKIVYENGGYLYVFDIKTQADDKIKVFINDDFIYSRSKLKDAEKQLRNLNVSPTGKRLVACARGDVFTIPVKTGITRNLTLSPSSHERNTVWSPDGKNIAFVSDKSGEFEIYIQKSDGSNAPVQLTKNADTYKFGIKWSPDSKKILWGDKKMRLRYVDVKTKAITEIDKSRIWEIRDFSWSPDSKFAAYTLIQANGINDIYIYDLLNKKKHKFSGGWFSASSPSFSSDGKYLFFTSAETFNPIYNRVEWNIAYQNLRKIYFALLSKDTKSPFAPENKEEGDKDESEGDKNTKSEKKEDDKKKVTVKIDFDGLKDRVVELPVKSGNYGRPAYVNGKLYYNRGISGTPGFKLLMYDFKKKKETELSSNTGFSVSSDNKKMLLVKDDKYYVTGIPQAKIELKKPIDLGGLKVQVNYKEEWKQIFDESWRQMRDFFYAPNMHGTDWNAIHKKYSVLLPYVNHRFDLTYIIGEMIGELSVGHAYVNSGESPKVEKIKTGLLGAKFTKDASGYFKISEILKGYNQDKTLRSPLTEPGLNIKKGDYIIAINSVETKTTNNIFSLLIGTSKKQVELTVNSKPSLTGSRKLIVVPIADESNLYYYKKIQTNIEKVNKATNGQVGYIHIPDMGAFGYNMFTKLFYPQLRKKALIIDDRGNGGGNVSPIVTERLRREIAYLGTARNRQDPYTNPSQIHLGPKVLLMNQYSASDGDLFPYQFKHFKLGKTIGVRSWGGVVGIRGSLPFVDGGALRKPEFAPYSPDGSEWIIEGYGVDPDIVIENDPAQEFIGKDSQLDKAIEVIMKELKDYPKPYKEKPEYPDKTK